MKDNISHVIVTRHNVGLYDEPVEPRRWLEQRRPLLRRCLLSTLAFRALDLAKHILLVDTRAEAAEIAGLQAISRLQPGLHISLVPWMGPLASLSGDAYNLRGYHEQGSDVYLTTRLDSDDYLLPEWIQLRETVQRHRAAGELSNGLFDHTYLEAFYDETHRPGSAFVHCTRRKGRSMFVTTCEMPAESGKMPALLGPYVQEHEFLRGIFPLLGWIRNPLAVKTFHDHNLRARREAADLDSDMGT